MLKLKVALVSIAAAVGLISAVAAQSTPAGKAAAIIKLKGASCGEIVGSEQDPVNRNIVVECSNGMIYGLKTLDKGANWYLTRRNTLTGKFDLVP